MLAVIRRVHSACRRAWVGVVIGERDVACRLRSFPYAVDEGVTGARLGKCPSRKVSERPAFLAGQAAR